MLLAALASAGIMGMALESYLRLVQAQNQTVMWSRTWNSAIPASEAGIEEALTHLNVIGPADRALFGWTFRDGRYHMSRTMGESRYVVSIENAEPPNIISTGFVRNPLQTAEVKRTVIVTTTRFGTGMRGMVAKGDIVMNGNSYTDSFDSEDPAHSTRGRYDRAKRKDRGFVGSVTGNVNTGGGSVLGDVGTGPRGRATGNVGDSNWVAHSTGIQTGHYQNDMNVSFPDVKPPFSGGAFTPASGTVTVTNYSYTSTVESSATYPSPEPEGGVSVTLNGTITTAEYPSSYYGSITTNTSAYSSTTYPASGTYVGAVVTRTVTSGPTSGRGTWYDYNRITGYTYQTAVYTWNNTTTNISTSTDTYAHILDDGNYQLSSVSMSGNEKMLIRGEATLYVTGDVSVTGNAQIIILPGGSLRLFVAGANADLSGNGVMNQNDDATKFSYYGLPTNTSLRMTGNAAFTGSIYAPNADFHLGGGGADIYDCVGATVTKTVQMNGHFNFHYDERLGRTGGFSRYRVASWHEI